MTSLVGLTGCGHSISGGPIETNRLFIAPASKLRFKGGRPQILFVQPLDSIRSTVAKPVDNFRTCLAAAVTGAGLVGTCCHAHLAKRGDRTGVAFVRQLAQNNENVLRFRRSIRVWTP